MRITPRNDLESNIIAYYSKEAPLRNILVKYQNKTAKGMLTKISNILSAAGYNGAQDPSVLLRPADASTIRELERIANGLPDNQRRKVLSKLYGQIGTGNLTVKRAIRDVIQFDTYTHSIDLYEGGKRALRGVADEAMLRGEYMVQKSVGIGWEVDRPGIERVDAFLKKRWTQNDATEFLKPMSKIVEDQISEGMLLGEHPDKLSRRIQNVEEISAVRANRMARTTVTAVSNDAQMDSYRKHGVRRYEFRAMFNERTCSKCGSLDGRIFNLDDKRPGINFPPIHPNCRCTTGAALSKEVKDRLKENAIKNGHALPLRDQMTFDEWKKQSVGPTQPKKERSKKVVPKLPETDSEKLLQKLDVEYRPVSKLEEPITSNEIVTKIGGPDRTAGSCSSLALAYAGNRNGLDVTDYRGGESREVFSERRTLREIVKITGGKTLEGTNDVKIAKQLLDENVVEGREYYFAAGKHAAIVRKVETGYEYLELQSSEDRNGFKPLNATILHDRFKCRKKGSYKLDSFIIDTEAMRDNPQLERLLGYINTKADRQMKGVGGYAK